ncbi:MAG: hypothetical protein D6806_02905 [Deltaproteobacteria bacterium]|nr:MAG: hypothetical protein D6806_02905 [Deltaproteobacteria bacterium]
MDDNAQLMAGVILAAVVVGFVVTFLRVRRKNAWTRNLVKVASGEVNPLPPHGFSLSCCPERPGKLLLMASLHRGMKSRGNPEHLKAPVVCRYKVTIGGEVKREESVGIDVIGQTPVDKRSTVSLNVIASREENDFSVRANHVLAELPDCPPGSEMNISGTFEPQEGVKLFQGEVSVVKGSVPVPGI